MEALFTTFVADVGPTGTGNLWGPRLHYARIGEEEYGQPRLAVSGEPSPSRRGRLSVRVLANPVQDLAAFEVSAGEPGAVRWEVFDVAGRRVRWGALDLAGEWSRLELPVSSLAAGAYLVRVVSEGGGSEARRFTVVR